MSFFLCNLHESRTNSTRIGKTKEKLRAKRCKAKHRAIFFLPSKFLSLFLPLLAETLRVKTGKKQSVTIREAAARRLFFGPMRGKSGYEAKFHTRKKDFSFLIPEEGKNSNCNTLKMCVENRKSGKRAHRSFHWSVDLKRENQFFFLFLSCVGYTVYD